MLNCVGVWGKDNPEVLEIRELYKKIEDMDKQKKLKKNTIESQGTGWKTTFYKDSKNMIWKVVREGGGEDSAVTQNFYYNEMKSLKFVFIQAGAVNGSKLEHRIYFGKDKKRLKELHKYTEGPGYTFPNPWPEEELLFDPYK